MTPVFIKLFFNISGGEIFIILLIVFIVFGPAKIPEVARSLGRLMNDAKKASSDISREFRKGTSDIEREYKKTTSEINNEFKPLTEDPLDDTEKPGSHKQEEKIPDVYLKNDSSGQSADEKHNETDEKSEKPIQ
jgi:sec-independent protein translocase protein TatA